MLKVIEPPESQPLSEENLTSMYNQLNAQEKQTLLQIIWIKMQLSLKTLIPMRVACSQKSPDKLSSMMCSILGYDNDKVVDEVVLGFMSSIYPSAINPLTRFIFSQHLVETLHYQLTRVYS
jgi:hypothetical protein